MLPKITASYVQKIDKHLWDFIVLLMNTKLSHIFSNFAGLTFSLHFVKVHWWCGVGLS